MWTASPYLVTLLYFKRTMISLSYGNVQGGFHWLGHYITTKPLHLSLALVTGILCLRRDLEYSFHASQ